MKMNIYQRITEQIMDNLERAGSWKKLWDVPQPDKKGTRFVACTY